MKARIDGFQYGDGVLIALVGFYYTEGEDGYEKPKRNVRKLLRRGEQEPFTTLPFPFDYNTTLDGLKVSILGQLNAFVAAQSRLPNYESWVGIELVKVIKES